MIASAAVCTPPVTASFVFLSPALRLSIELGGMTLLLLLPAARDVACRDDGHVIIDQHPQAGNVWLVGGGSGHGFKLSPAVGAMVAGAIVEAKEIPELFRLARLRNTAKPSTQFERK